MIKIILLGIAFAMSLFTGISLTWMSIKDKHYELLPKVIGMLVGIGLLIGAWFLFTDAALLLQ